MHVNFIFRKALYISATLFWLVTMGMLIQRNYGILPFLPGSSSPGLQGVIADSDITGEQWMGVYLNGEKLGFLSRIMSPDRNGYAMEEALRIRMIVMGKEKEIETVLKASLDKNLRLRSFTASLKTDVDLELSGKVTGRDLSLAINASGVKTTKYIHLNKEPTLNGPAVTGMLRGMKSGDRISIPIFDPSLMGIEDLDLTVSVKEKILSLGKLQEAYKVKGNMKGLEFTAWITERGEVLREESQMGLLLVKETKEDALRITRPSLDLISQAAVPFTMKLPPEIAYLKVRLAGISFKGLELRGGRQRLTGDELEVYREDIDAVSKTRNPEIRGMAFEEYLRDTIFIQSKDPQIIRLALEIVQDEKDRLVAARLIYDWVFRNIEKTPTITIPMATEVLRTKKGDCNEHTTLFAALARAVGIPAKIAVGLTYKDGFFYYHAWPEFYADRWIAIDPTLGQFPADAAHIRLITGDLDRQIQILPVLSKIHIEGLEYR